MDDQLLSILACPICHKSLSFIKKKKQLICEFDLLSFKICNGVPILLKNHSKNDCIEKI